MDEKYNAICVYSVNWRESDKLIKLFTLENGMVDCVIRGAKSPKSKWHFAKEPFCFAEYVLTERNGKKALKEANEIDSFYNIRTDVDKFYAASAILEFIRNFVLDGIGAYELFLITINSLKAIENSDYPNVALLKFFIPALKEVGYQIELDKCYCCGGKIENRAFFDFEEGKPTCEKCQKSDAVEMRISTFNLLNLVNSLDIEIFKNNDLSTYSEAFTDKTTIFYALKFITYYIERKSGVLLKTNSQILETLQASL